MEQLDGQVTHLMWGDRQMTALKGVSIKGQMHSK
jgi:hypothetical protein